MPLKLVHPLPPFDARAESMLPGIGGFPPSDRNLFLAGYSELCRVDLTGKHALEICGGFGKLACGLAQNFPEAKITGLDLYAASGPQIDEALKKNPGLEFVAGDAFDLSRYPDNSVDLVWGQAALHHLSHDLDGLCNQVSRVLKPGGRFIFIFEPLGHNLLVAAIRAMRIAREELGDECNVFISQFAQMETYFSSCEVQVFNLLGYPMKAFSDRFSWLSSPIRRMDAWIFKTFPKTKRYGANCNVILTK